MKTIVIGHRNEITMKLVESLNDTFPVEMVELNSESIVNVENSQPNTVFVNIMDLENRVTISKQIKDVSPNSTLVGIHCFQNESMLSKIKEQGYDYYISVLDFEKDMAKTMNQINSKY